MNSAFKEVYDQFLAVNHQQRINAAVNGVAEVFKYLEARGADADIQRSFFGTFLGLFIGVDGTITPEEASIFNEIFGTKYAPQELVEFVSQCLTSENYEAINGIVDAMDEETKAKACWIALAVIAADGKVTEEEANLFEDLWA